MQLHALNIADCFKIREMFLIILDLLIQKSWCVRRFWILVIMMDSSTISQIGQIYLTKKCVMNEIRGKLGMLSQTEMVIQNTLNCLCVRQRLGGSVDG